MDNPAKMIQNDEKRRMAHEALDRLLGEAERHLMYGSVGVRVTVERGVFDIIHTDHGQTHK